MRRRAIAGAGLLLVAALTACASATPVSAAPPHPWEPVVTPEPVDPDAAYVAARLAGMSVAEQAASVILMHLPGDGAAMRDAIAASGIAGVILMGDDTRHSVEATAALTAALAADPGLPPLTAVDQEGGIVARLPDAGPSARALAGQPVEATREAFAARAALVASADIEINFGIVADVTGDPRSFLAPRVFGGDAASVAERVAAAVAGERGVVLSTLKHFPGHGAPPGDSHSGVPTTALGLAEWSADTALPFAAGVDAGAQLLMFGHLVYSSVDPVPASLSAEWHRIAREQLGFTGVAISDDLGMLLDSGLPEYQDLSAVVVQALAAGADMALVVRNSSPESLPGLIDAVTAAVDAGALPEARLREAAVRVAELRLAIGDAAL